MRWPASSLLHSAVWSCGCRIAYLRLHTAPLSLKAAEIKQSLIRTREMGPLPEGPWAQIEPSRCITSAQLGPTISPPSPGEQGQQWADSSVGQGAHAVTRPPDSTIKGDRQWEEVQAGRIFNDPKSWQLITSLIRRWKLSLRDAAKEAP